MKNKLLKKINLIAIIIVILSIVSCKNKKDMNKELETFVKNFEAKYKPLYKEMALASFNSYISGKDEDYKKSADCQMKLTKIFSNKEDFKILKEIKESNQITDDIKKRELKVLYNAFLSNQVDTAKLNEMIKIGNTIEKKFNLFRTEVDGKKLTDNDVEGILKNSTKNDELMKTWMAVKKSGPMVAEDIKKLVKLRNEVAKELGFKNYHEMSLTLSDQDPQEITKIFDELDNLTRDAFAKTKSEMDEYLAKRLNIKKEDLKPWHYQNRFFQEAPKIYKVDLDGYFKGKNIEKLTVDYFAGVGLDITDMVKNSDLYEKKDKYQHACCMDMDNEGDVRVICNVKDNSKWMGTMLHEYGHAVYDKNIDRNLPFVLRDPAHTFTTEAVAMLFERFATNPEWLKQFIGISQQEADKISEDCFKTLRLEKLVFSRWAQVMYNFEKNLYENPDQDLGKLWWDLVEKYQMIKRPDNRTEPDWATKIHIATSPCYYHNYLLGDLLASQFFFTVGEKVLKSKEPLKETFIGKKEVGQYFTENVFKPGAKYYWNNMIEKATGEKLTPKFYAKQFVN